MTTPLIGIQEPRILCPPGVREDGSSLVVGSLGDDAVEMAELAGLNLDPWQNMSLQHMLAIKSDDYYNKYTKRHEFKWAARTCGLVVSRQNGKGSILEARELAALFLARDRFIIHSAHEHDTAQEAHTRLLELIENVPEYRKQVLRAPMGHGEQGIELRNGQRMRFRTRTKGGGRGFTADLVVLDEAMILEDAFVGALMPTLSQRPNPQLIYTGSAGTQQSEAFGRVRRNALNGSLNTFFAEWSIEPCNAFCPPGCDEHDRIDDIMSWLKANPSYGLRELGYDDIIAEYETMSKEQFMRERLGVGDWPQSESGWLVIPEPYWSTREDISSELIGKFCLAVDVEPDGAMSSLAAAGQNQHGDTHIELTGDELGNDDFRPGTQWVVPRIKEIWRRARPEFVVIDPATNAGDFITDLQDDGITVISPSSREYAQACQVMHGGIVPRREETAYVTHIGQASMTKAVSNLAKRKLGDGIAWDKANAVGSISPFVAATNACWGFRKHVKTAKSAGAWGAYR